MASEHEAKAPGLQRSSTMKRWLVGMVAAVSLAGCGVGVDDPEGRSAAGLEQVQNGLMAQDTVANATPSANTATSLADPVASSVQPSSPGTPNALPQDPVPLITGRPFGPGPDPRALR